MMAITFKKEDPHAKIIAALLARGDKPYTPKQPPKGKLVVKPKKDGLYIGWKGNF